MTSPTPASPLPPVIYATLKKTTARGDLVGCPPVFMPFGAVTSFCGPVVMGKCFEDNSLAKAAVDGSGLLQTPAGLVRAVRVAPRCALPGGNLGARAKAMWRCKFRTCGSTRRLAVCRCGWHRGATGAATGLSERCLVRVHMAAQALQLLFK